MAFANWSAFHPDPRGRQTFDGAENATGAGELEAHARRGQRSTARLDCIGSPGHLKPLLSSISLPVLAYRHLLPCGSALAGPQPLHGAFANDARSAFRGVALTKNGSDATWHMDPSTKIESEAFRHLPSIRLGAQSLSQLLGLVT